MLNARRCFCLDSAATGRAGRGSQNNLLRNSAGHMAGRLTCPRTGNLGDRTAFTYCTHAR